NQVRVIESLACLPLGMTVCGISGRRKYRCMTALNRFLADRLHSNALAIHPTDRMKYHLLAYAGLRATTQLHGDVLAVVIGESGRRLDNLIHSHDSCALVNRHIFHRGALQLFDRALKNESRFWGWVCFPLTCWHTQLL